MEGTVRKVVGSLDSELDGPMRLLADMSIDDASLAKVRSQQPWRFRYGANAKTCVMSRWSVPHTCRTFLANWKVVIALLFVYHQLFRSARRGYRSQEG